LLAAAIERRADPELYQDARAIARAAGWAKTYDAEYVALAHRLDVPLITPRRARPTAAPAALTGAPLGTGAHLMFRVVASDV